MPLLYVPEPALSPQPESGRLVKMSKDILPLEISVKYVSRGPAR
jgi:hypothetical protein